MAVGTSLRAQSPLELLDGALSAVRRGGFEAVGQGLAAGAPLALVALSIYYLERVEGVRSLRPLFAMLLTAAWLWRVALASRLARAYALRIRPTLPMPEGGGRPIDVACTAALVGLGLWAWLWLLVFAAILSPVAVAAAMPLLAVRGGVAPSWLARAGSTRSRGLSCFGEALDDTAGMRGVFLAVELMLLVGTLGLFGNLYALGSFGLLMAHGVLGLDVAFVSSFLSPDNTLALLLFATVTLLLMEPLRAATSAQAFVEARSRRDGADLHAAVDAAIASARPRRRLRIGSEPPAAALCLLGALAGAPAIAEAQAVMTPDAVALEPDRDQDVRSEVRTILLAPEFREFSQRDSSSLDAWLKRLFAWLDDKNRQQASDPGPTTPLPAATPWILMALALLLLIAIGLYAGRYRHALSPPRRSGGTSTAVALDAPPDTLLEEAAALAETGDYAGALRLLYLATLGSLDRAGLIRFDPSHTNGQYLRAMRRGPARKHFASFTRIFDHTFYGHVPATAQDYARCRSLADELCREPAP